MKERIAYDFSTKSSGFIYNVKAVGNYDTFTVTVEKQTRASCCSEAGVEMEETLQELTEKVDFHITVEGVE